jgi:putative oxidoreductase
MATVTERTAAPPAEGAALLLGRLLLAAIFLWSGFGKLTNLGGFVQSLAHQGVPAPEVLGVVGACVEFFGGLAVAVGFRARWAALLMVAFTIAATLIAHRFWEVQDAAARAGQQVNFMKNVAIVGGFLLLSARGAGPISVDREP